MKIRGFEKALYVISAVGVGTALYLLFFRSSKIERPFDKRQGLATVKPLGSDIRLKPQGDLSWQALRQNETAFDRDTVFTGRNSRATIDFNSGTQLLVDPDSLLIVARENEKDKILTLDYGGFSGKILKGEKITLQTKDQRIEISGLEQASIRIEKTQDQKFVVSALEGNLQVKSDLAVEELQPNEQLKITAENIFEEKTSGPAVAQDNASLEPEVKLEVKEKINEPTPQPELRRELAPAPVHRVITRKTASNDREPSPENIPPLHEPHEHEPHKEEATAQVGLADKTEVRTAEPPPPVATPTLFPTPTPAATSLIAEHKRGDVQDELVARAMYRFTQVNITDSVTGAGGNLYTDHDVEWMASWITHWSKGFLSAISFGIRSFEFRPSTSDQQTLSNNSQTQKEISIAARHPFNEKLSFGYGIQYGEKTFLHGTSSNNVSVDSVPVPSATTELTYKFYHVNSRALGLVANASYLGGASTSAYSVSGGYAAASSFFYERSFQQSVLSSMRLSLGYEFRQQNTSIAELKESSVFLGLILGIPVFEENRGAP